MYIICNDVKFRPWNGFPLYLISEIERIVRVINVGKGVGVESNLNYHINLVLSAKTMATHKIIWFANINYVEEYIYKRGYDLLAAS